MSAEHKIVSPPTGRRSAKRGRGGFSFTEILFAVMILGIGFIMVAAMFPVAIQQTQESLDETTAADMAKEAAHILARIGNDPSCTPGNPTGTFPDTQGLVVCPSTNTTGTKWGPFLTATAASTPVPPFWNLVSGNLISSHDSRYAWVPFYRRGTVNGTTNQLNNFAQVIIIPVLDRNTGSFSGFNSNLAAVSPSNGPSYDLTAQTPGGAGAPFANLQGRMVSASFFLGSGNIPDAVTIAADVGNITSPTSPYGNANSVASQPASPAGAQDCAATGAYLIVADDKTLGNYNSAINLPSCNGYIYQIGNPVPFNTNSYFLVPGNDMKNARYQPLSFAGVNSGPGSVSLSSGNYTLQHGQAVRCYIVGRGFNNPSGSAVDVVSPFTPSGPAMDISAFSTFFRVQG